MKFDFIIGNPPYQEENTGGNKSFAAPVYHKFIDETYKLANCVELIHPARFLFNAGATPADWNLKMLNNTHLKVLGFYLKSGDVFPNTDIKGGVAITYYSRYVSYGAIGTFTQFDELDSIIRKVKDKNTQGSLVEIIFNQTKFNLEKLYAKHPELKNVIGSEGRDKRFRNNIFDKVNLFTENKKSDDDVQILGLINNKRYYRYFPMEFIDTSSGNFFKYKVMVPQANGTGAIGEVLSTPLIGQPLIGHTQSFISIGSFDTEIEAQAALKYIKTKFARVMLGILKITQHNPPEIWKYVPLQDFTEKSDIDWSKSIAEIDQQLYKKYGLDEKEFTFIETHVKEMS